MSSTPHIEVTAQLRAINLHLRRLAQNSSSSERTNAAPAPPGFAEEISKLFCQLQNIGKLLHSLPETRTAAAGDEFARLREELEQLRDILPALRRVLVQEHARLDRGRRAVSAASEWVRSSRQTL